MRCRRSHSATQAHRLLAPSSRARAASTRPACRKRARKPLIMGLSQQEAVDLFRSDDLIGIGMAANQLRKRKNDPRVASYQIDRNINYTNFCTEYCSFCAFYRPLGSKEGYILSLDTILQKIEETIALGGTGILMQGGLHPDLRIDYYENLCARSSRASRKFICIVSRRRKCCALPKSQISACAIPLRACAMPASAP